MMEAAPAAAFVMPEPNLLLELLVVALDAPAQFCKIDEPLEADILRQRRETVFGRLFFALGPLDQQPLRRQLLGDQLVVSDTDAHPRKARGQLIGRALSPRHRTPGPLRQAKRHLLGRD